MFFLLLKILLIPILFPFYFTMGRSWALWNEVFGWDYISWNNGVDNGVARVYKNSDGVTYYIRYKATGLFDRIKKPGQVLWLTCSHKKYLGEESIGADK